MADGKEKKDELGVSVRVPQWVLDEVETEIRAKPRPRPTRGELLTEAWRVYKSSRAGADSTSELSDMGESVPEGGSEVRQPRLESVSSDRSDSDTDLAKEMAQLRGEIASHRQEFAGIRADLAKISKGDRPPKKQRRGDGSRSGKKAS